MDHILQAVHDTVHDSDIKTKEIASRLGMGHQVLINKANPQCETHKITLLEAVAIQKITGSSAILRAVQVELDIPPSEEECQSYLEATLHFTREFGDVVRSIEEGMKDGKLTARELERFMRETDELDAAMQRLRASVLRAHTDNAPQGEVVTIQKAK